ncbi:glycosyltransferase [Chloroflexota bacterium]
MKILQVLPYFFLSSTEDGSMGSVELLQNLSQYLFRQSNQVTIYTTDAFKHRHKSRFRTKIIDVEGVRVCEFKSLGGELGQRHHICISPAMIPAMAKEIHNFDIVHLHEYRTFQNIIAHHYAKQQGVPYVLEAHGSLPRIMSKEKLKQVYDNLWGYKLLEDASKVIACTKIEAEQYKNMGVIDDKIEVIPYGINLLEYNNLPKRGEFKEKYGLADKERIILYLGRIHQIKGLDLLAKAFAKLPQYPDKIRLVIVGPDDGYLSSLERLIVDLRIDDKVLLTGPLYGREKLRAYVDADVYVLPSYYEIFSITTLEAGACGTPVIVTDRCGIADMIDRQAGLVIPCEEEKLQQALDDMLSNDKMRQEFSRKGKALVYKKFNGKQVAAQMGAVYEDILNISHR